MSDAEKLEAVFEELTPEQREFIMNAFDKVEPEILEYQPGKFISCHTDVDVTVYTVDVKTEYWSCGTKKS